MKTPVRTLSLSFMLGLGAIPALGQSQIGINDRTVTEGNAGQTSVVLDVTLSPASADPVSVTFLTQALTASAGAACGSGIDFVTTGGVVTFPAGSTSQPISVAVCGDAIDEPNEEFEVSLKSPTGGATIADSRGRATITDDDEPALPSLSMTNVTVPEGDTGTTDAVFTVTLSAPAAQTVTVGFGTLQRGDAAGGTPLCAFGLDFGSVTNGTLTFAPGVTTQTIVVPVCGDLADESNETFEVNLFNPAGATEAGFIPGRATILDDDEPFPAISIGNVEVVEGGTPPIPVTLSEPRSQPVTVRFIAEAGIASGPGVVCGLSNDFLSAAGILTFAPGVTSQTITLQICQDTLPEIAETFSVRLHDPVGATLPIPDRAQVTIVDDDVAQPTLLVHDLNNVAEGNAGSREVPFFVGMSGSSTQAVDVQLSLILSGDANPGTCGVGAADFGFTPLLVTFPPGSNQQEVRFTVCGDNLDEPNETFRLKLFNPHGALLGGSGEAVITITDDDEPVLPVLSIIDLTAAEGNVGSRQLAFNVNMGEPATVPVTVQLATAPETATGGTTCGATGVDFINASTLLTFAPGVNLQTALVTLCADFVDESDETFLVKLSNPTGATLAAPGQARVRIVDDDEPGQEPPALTIADGTVTESDGLRLATLVVSLTKPIPATVTFNPIVGAPVRIPLVSPAQGGSSCTRSVDFRTPIAPVTIAAGGTSANVVLVICGDLSPESTEAIVVVVPPIEGVTLSDDRATMTITDND